MSGLHDRFAYMTLDQAARARGMTPAAVRQRVERGEIKGIRMLPLHWLWLIPRQQVKRWQARYPRP